MPLDIDIRAAREALKCAIDEVPGLTVYSRFPGVIKPPCAIIYRRETRYDPMMDGGADIILGVRVYTSIANPSGSQDRMDDYFASAGTHSIVAAIYADPTLNGTVNFLKGVVAEEEGVGEYKGVDYISADLVVGVG